MDWSLEELEPRLLLAGDAGQEVGFALDSSGIQVQAIGDTGQEVLEVIYNEERISYFRVSDQWETYQINVDYTTIDPSLLRIHFVNDLYDPAQGIDRNVQLGSVTIGDQVLDSNAANVFSTGTWLPEDGVISGQGRGSVLNANGYLQYGTPSGSELIVYARGDEGGETMNVLAGSFRSDRISLTTKMTAYKFYLNTELEPSSVRVEFLNDLYRPDLGIDYNLVVDRIEIDGVVHQTEDPTTFAQGVYRDGALTSGNWQTERLEGRGHFQFDASDFTSERYTLDDSIAEAGVSIISPNLPFDVEHEITSSDQSAVGWSESFWTESGQYQKIVQVQLFDENGSALTSFHRGEPVELIQATMEFLDDDSLESSQFSLKDLEVDSQDRLLARLQVFHYNGNYRSYSNVLVRLTSDGQLDSSFGDGGFVPVSLGGITTASSMTIDSQDRILISNAVTISRYNADGTADNSFGTNGASDIPLPQEPDFYAGQSQILTRPDDSILVLWGIPSSANASAGWLIQLNEDGSTGTWFGDEGFASIPYQQFSEFSSYSERFERMVLDDEGRLTILGTQALLRFTIDGQIDPSFGDGGRIILPSSIVTDGSLLFDNTGGTFGLDGLGRYLVHYFNGVARLTPDGQLDTSFSADGISAYNPDEIGSLQPYSLKEGKFDSDGELRTLAQNDNGFGVAFWQLV
ncbi:carbohydrate-binding domain-containing protein [Rhodopirellula sp. P2]|uniref:carbohydrate-binding domain-containing protein n=1 Tax=Rhodopirellula sp. P2 TaxID=2127060 RepID=UPI0023681F34|nr:carbohydrate-binding domain-containing protein [Rhodopirellula sp. P2]WDQ15304.1 carbohydrate-binding domain-containing protein [Rhodopirellula sp. P2]